MARLSALRLAVTAPGWIGGIDPARYDLLSCDVFDTLLVRPYAEPASLFETLAYEQVALLPASMSPAQWRAARIAAERAARLRHRPAEITLAQIYACLGEALTLPAPVLAELADAEIALEQRCLAPVAGMVEGLAAWRKSGGAVRFVSDMYLPSAVVAGAVVEHGGTADAAQVIVSSDSGLSKHTGSLFAPMLSAANCPAARAFHIGDSPHADVAMPLAQGMAAGLVSDTGLTRFERLAAGPDASFIRSASAGSSRAARVSRSFDTGHQGTVWQVGTGVAGPLVTGFVLWALLQAEKQGLTKLWFLARDGEVMTALAQRLVQRFGIAVEPRYLYASRQALFLPSLDTETPQGFADGVVQMGQNRSIAQLAWSLELEPEALGPEAMGDAAHCPTPPELRELAARLWQSPAMEQLRKTAANRRAATLAYWREEGLTGEGRVGIVDVGWKGNLQTFMARILAREFGASAPAISGYYFGLRQQPAADAGPTHTYCTPAQIRLPTDLLEIFCAATHGSVRAMELDAAGTPAPVLMTEDAAAIAQWGVALQQEAMLAFCEKFCGALPRSGLANAALVAPLRAAGLAAFEALCFRPTVAEAQAYGSFQFSADPMHSRLAPLAPPPRGLSATLALLRGSPWWQGSAMRAQGGWPARLFGHTLVVAANSSRSIRRRLAATSA